MPPGADKPDSFAAGAQFPPTLWSVVLRAGQSSSDHHEALATLCRAYWFPLYAFLRRQGKSPPDAEDLTQGFMLHLLEKDTLSRARREKGKFRSFLLASLQYFLCVGEKLYQALLEAAKDPCSVFSCSS